MATSTLLFAQLPNATINGRVTESQGATISGAQVTVPVLSGEFWPLDYGIRAALAEMKRSPSAHFKAKLPRAQSTRVSSHVKRYGNSFVPSAGSKTSGHLVFEIVNCCLERQLI